MSTQYSILCKQEQAHRDAIWSVAWGKNTNDGSETVVSGSLDDLVKVWKWNGENLDLQWTLEGHQLGVVSVDVSHTGNIAASSSLDAHIRLWDLDSGKQMRSIDAGPGHAMPIRSLTFSPDSQLLVTGSDDGYIKIYDVQHASLAGTLSGHGSWVLNVAFSPDDAQFVSSSSDKSVKVWDVASRTCVHTFFDHQEQVWGVQYNRNGSKIVSVGDDQEIHIYDCPI
uniref:Superkiller complex protein 8 n=1 Tax=Pyxicephalus adspersus TaxID=30357 RepID=A0AAV3B542_PYXAD|nr:TPA: hypothetical protein GDO54_000676 [Pyxicephalus adspersus]